MNDTPTPRTDAALRYCKTRNESGREDMAGYSVLGIQKIIVESKNLECELTAAREELKAVTEQRDRLAEALRKLTEYDLGDIPIGVVRKCNEALQSLTTNAEL